MVGRFLVWLGEDWKGWVRFDENRWKRLGGPGGEPAGRLAGG